MPRKKLKAKATAATEEQSGVEVTQVIAKWKKILATHEEAAENNEHVRISALKLCGDVGILIEEIERLTGEVEVEVEEDEDELVPA